MLRRKTLLLTVSSLLMVSTLMAMTNPSSSTAIQKMNQMPLAFTKNMGQWDERVLFRANVGGATMWFTKEGVTYQFTRRIDKNDAGSALSGPQPLSAMSDLDSRLRADGIEKDSVEQLILTAKFVGANPNPEVLAERQMEYKCNYFLGNDPSKWHTDVPNYEAITLKDIYSGIDLRFSSDSSGQAVYKFMAAPEADLAQFKVEYAGAEETSLDAEGKLILKTKWGNMAAAIQPPSDFTISGQASFSRLSEKTSGFEVDRSTRRTAGGSSGQALGTLSVGLVYSTYLGGGGADECYGIAVDGSGNAYVTGLTYSPDFPTLNPYQTYQGGIDVFVTKLSSSGSSLIYSTYLGGGSEDRGDGITIDGSGNAYVTGRTSSGNFPTQNPYQGALQGGEWDAFVTKLSSSGNNLIYSTYLGGGGNEYGQGIAVDGDGNTYVTGNTFSFDFPTLNPYQTNQDGWDAFVTKFSGSGNSLIYSTYLGGGDNDYASKITIDGNGNAYVMGITRSTNFPTLNSYQSTFQGGAVYGDVFVTKLSSAGNSLIYSTYVGGGDDDQGWGMAVDGSGSVCVTGYTTSSNFPILNPYQATNHGYSDIFVTKLNSAGNSLIYSTYLGGEDVDYGYRVAVDGNGSAYVMGYTYSSDFPTLNPFQATRAGYLDVVITKLSSSGNSLTYSTYLGGGDNDYGYGMAIDGSGSVYVTGYTWSSDFPTLNPYQTDQVNSCDAFVTKLSYFNESDYVITPTPDTADVFYIKQADIDGDNRTDVFYTGNTGDSLYIAYGKADGTLETPRNYLKVTKAALAVDFVNGDSRLDIVARTTGKVYVLFNTGNRNFAIDSMVVSPSFSRSESERSTVFPALATGFFNNDAHLDIVVSENKILFGNGSGGFSTPATLPFFFDAVAVSDFDRNGIDDIVVTAGDTASIYLNDGSGTMTRSAALRIGYFTHDFSSVSAGMDLNHDDKTDFVTLTGNTIGADDTSVVTIALGNGTGGVTGSDTLRIVGTALNLALADVDKDHNLDISLVNATTRALLIMANDGSGSFSSPVSTAMGSGTNPLYALIDADVDRNGAPDFVIGGQEGNPILLAINEIPDDPILPQEMVTTGYNYVTLRMENPLGLVISRPLSTVAGSAYWRTDADDNNVLDEIAYDYNLQYGEYRVVITSRTNVPGIPLFNVGIRIDGTEQNTVFQQYSVPAPGENIVFYYQVEPVSSIYPANGHPTANPQPTFKWSGLVTKGLAADSYEFQLDRYYDFRSPIFNVTGLTSRQYHIPHSLGADSVFYWRIRPVTGGIPGDYSRTFAAYLLNYLCGDANADAAVDISDVVYLIAYIFSGGSAPSPLLAGDANCDSAVDISDVVYLIAYIFSGGLAPCAACK